MGLKPSIVKNSRLKSLGVAVFGFVMTSAAVPMLSLNTVSATPVQRSASVPNFILDAGKLSDVILVHCCHSHPYPPYDNYCCHPPGAYVAGAAVATGVAVGVAHGVRRAHRHHYHHHHKPRPTPRRRR